ncbi:MAG: BTAD domain-containing putative transcriptional regulator [Calditrichia bacterium]
MSQKSNILFVDDEESNYFHFKALLDGSYLVIRAKTGRKATDIIKEKKIDLIFLSDFPEDIEGLKLLKILKKSYPSIPIVFIAAALTVEKTIQIFRAGARDILQQPLKREEVKDILDTILELIRQNNFKSEIDKVVSSIQKVPDRKVQRQRRRIKWENFPIIRNCGKQFQIFLQKIKVLFQNIYAASDISPANSFKKIDANKKGMGDRLICARPELKVYFLGEFRVYLNDILINSWTSKKARSLFSYIILNHKRRIHRDVLMNRFWPNSGEDSARNCLNVTLHGIRNNLNSGGFTIDVILYYEDCYFLNPEIELRTDYEDFRKMWQKAQAVESEKGINAALMYYENAKHIYMGDFLEDEPFEELWESDRENLKEIYLFVLDKISGCYSLNGKPEVAIKICQEILKKDQCREDIHQRLMRCYYRIGKRDQALRQFDKCVRIMKTELKVEPMKSTINLFNLIREDSLKLSQFKDLSNI